MARIPEDRRADGTGLWSHAPVITANSNSPRNAAIRWFIVDAAAPRPVRRSTTLPAAGLASQSKKSNTSIGVSDANARFRSSQNRRKLNTWNAYARTVNGENARTPRCNKNPFASSLTTGEPPAIR